MAARIVAPRRRNGKHQACEPCRIRKSGCDHIYPVCSRCERRGVAESCIYVQAPSDKRRPARIPPGLIPSNVESSFVASPHEFSVPSSSSVPSASNDNPVPASRQKLPTFDGTRSYLGPTSFRAVFQENEQQLHLGNHEQTNSWVGSPLSVLTLPSKEPRCALSGHLAEVAEDVFRHIPPPGIAATLFQRHINPNDGWIRLAASKLNKGIWPAFGNLLREGLHNSLVHYITRNTQNVFEEDKANAKEWLDALLGTKLRWELLGILFTYWTFGAISSPIDSSVFDFGDGRTLSRGEFIRELKVSTSSCISICETITSGNSLMIYLLYKDNLLNAVLNGEASDVVSRCHGRLVALTTSLGLHRLPDPVDGTLSVSIEARKRIYTSVYNIDKVIATFTGRPPLLCARYASTTLPADISDETLLGDNHDLERALASIDERGYNLAGNIYSTTILRARNTFAQIREEILEAVLSTHLDCANQRAYKLRETARESYTNISRCVQWEASDLANSHLTGQALYTKVLTRLEHLQNLFLLERFLTKQTGSITQDLVEICSEMLQLTLLWWKHHDRFGGLESDFEWLVVSYSASPSGILCIELLKQSTSCERMFHQHGSVIQNPGFQISHSKTIQNLSLLVGFLDWILVSAPPTSDICSRIRGIISNVLDRVLEPRSSRTRVSPFGASNTVMDEQGITEVEALEQAFHIQVEDMNLANLESEGFNFDILDTYSWLDNLDPSITAH